MGQVRNDQGEDGIANVAQTIREATATHLTDRNGLLLAQCVSAVGWIGGTVPQHTGGIVELSMADVAGAGIAVGAALAGRRPIYVIRYQGFMWYDAAPLLNYAAKSKEVWNVPCPIFIRSIGSNSAGPVAGGLHHGMVTRMPGIRVVAPMTPGEWTEAWTWFLAHDEPVYCSEHRSSFKIDYEMNDRPVNEGADIALFAISSTRLTARKVVQERVCTLFHIRVLKPFVVTEEMVKALKHSRRGLVLDCDYPQGAKSIAHDLMLASGVPVEVLALEDRTAGFGSHANDGPSVERILEVIK